MLYLSTRKDKQISFSFSAQNKNGFLIPKADFEASEKQDLASNGIQFLEEVFKQGSIIGKGESYFSKNPDGEKMGCQCVMENRGY